jgi:phosphoglycerate kinase
MGMFEEPEYSHGTHEMLRAIEYRTDQDCTTIVCGGETVAAVEQFGCKNFTHVSMGGAAALEVLGGKEIPGVTVLKST